VGVECQAHRRRIDGADAASGAAKC
jgi:hypothetical protein